MEETINQLRLIIEDISIRGPEQIQWKHKPSPEKWSKIEIMGHLVDSAQVNLQRFVRCTYQENFKLVYEQDEWVRAARYQEAGSAELLTLWRLINRQIIRVLVNYPADRLLAKCDSSRASQSFHTVEWLAEDYVAHMKHHLNQIYGSDN